MSAVVVLVWYRVAPANSAQCLGRFDALRAAVTARFGVAGRLGWRDEPAKDRRTWLESWEPLDESLEPAFVEALEEQARTVGLSELALDGRYVEVFRWSDDAAAVRGAGPGVVAP